MSNITEATQSDYNDFWHEDDISLTGNPNASPDVVVFGSGLPGGAGQDHLALDRIPDFPTSQRTSRPGWKYNEEEIIKELSDYISATYNQHYSAGDDRIQTLDLIEACGDGEAFCRSNILKYASRYDKKGTARRDIMKILHYAVLLLHFNDKNSQVETYPQ